MTGDHRRLNKEFDVRETVSAANTILPGYLVPRCERIYLGKESNRPVRRCRQTAMCLSVIKTAKRKHNNRAATTWT